MLYFHYCQSYLDKTNAETDQSVKKNLKEYSTRNSLKGIGKIASFTKGIYVLRLQNPYAEIILEERNVVFHEKNITVYFVRGFKNGLQDYVEIRDGKWATYNELDPSELQRFIQDLQNSSLEENENLGSPPQELLSWQSDYKLRVDYDIYETEEWVKFAMNNSSDEGMRIDEPKMYLLVLKEMLAGNPSLITEIDKTDNYTTCQIVFNDLGIVYTKVVIDQKPIYILHNGGNTKTQTNHWEKVKTKKIKQGQKFENLHDVSTMSLKAYPGWTLNHADLWSKIEKNNEIGNLSLLPEQTEFLKQFKFPKYINGQAGSGKSTMLYYLFANVYYYKYAGEIKGDIIFLTENEKLLEHTKKSVYDLLLHNPEFDLSSEDIAIVNVDKHFHPFKTFLLSLLPEDNSMFRSEKYLNFSKFKLLYEQSNIANHIKKRFSAELVWFALSTYVFGNNLNCEITSENYETEMPREGKELISLEDLKGIERDIIQPFYKRLLRDEQYWDKIKLIKYISENIPLLNRYDVIFCDEAQDFSRVELDFILKLSSYTQYNLTNVEQFPIVFAGDALQTVNPTGFRSEALTAMIYSELTSGKTGYKLDPSTLEFTPTYNYRSSQSIVNVANAIQNYRKEKFSANIKSPQTSKRPVVFEYEHLNVFVDYDVFKNDLDLQKKAEFKTIIIPVNYDEIENYKLSHPILNKFENIISAVDAKGLDFSEVVIYGFGDYISNRNGGVYENRFLYNKLYVAVTRAQAELVIIDDFNSKETFWMPLIDMYLQSDWVDEVKPRPSNFADIIIFDSNEIIQSSPNVLEHDAFRQKNQGILEKNIPLLQVASSHFIKIGNKKEYYVCLAQIEEIKGDWKKASEHYLKKEVGNDGIEMAINSLWSGKLWGDLVKLNVPILNKVHRLMFILSEIFIAGTVAENNLNQLYENQSDLSRLLGKTIWRKEVLNLLVSLLDKETDNENIAKIAEIITENCNKTEVGILARVGDKYFGIKKYQLAIEAFENAGIETENYLNAKLELAKRRGNIEDVIIFSGRIAQETDSDKKLIAKEIVLAYLDNNLVDTDFKNIYVNLYVYIAFLLTDCESPYVINLAKKVELSFGSAGRQIELADFYHNLLKSDFFGGKVFNYILERWAKNSHSGGVDFESINKLYFELSEDKKSKYVPFSEDEIISIPEVPIEIEEKLTEHLSEIQIENFRKFDKLHISNLGLVNLVVGDNNVGKTSLLEAFLFTPDKNVYLERLAFAYIERVNIHPDKNETSEGFTFNYNLGGNFLKDYHKCNSNSNDVIFKLNQGRFYNEYQIDFLGYSKKTNQESYVLDFSESDLSLLKNIPYENCVKMPFIAYGKGYGQELANVYEREIRSERELEKSFLQNLKLFIPSVENIFVRLDGSIDVRDSDYAVDRPLHQYGEGANKLFRILVLLTLHRGKRLLIDEIDVGIHFSRFKEFWRILLQIASRDNTQIIATTHNEECIRFFTEVLLEDNFGEKFQSLSRVVQLKFVNRLKARSFDFQSFNMAFEDGVELRGGDS